MIKHPLYLLYALAILGTTGMAEFRGFTLQTPDVIRNIPRSIRNNPGAYRSHYGGYSRYIGGK